VGGYGIGVGSRGEQPGCVGSQVDVPWKGSAYRLNLNDLEFSTIGIGTVNRDTVMASVGGIYESSARVDENLGRGIERLIRLIALAQGRLGGQGFGRSVGRIPCEGGDREAQLVKQVNEFSVDGETHVAGASTGYRLSNAVGGNGWFGGVDLVDDDLIEPEVGHECVLSIRRKSCPVGVWRLLPALDYL